jgi:hypothetical protein
MSATFTFYCDPGHGWLKVSKADCFDIGLWGTDFSAYSYQNGAALYLEEDSDAGIFLDAYRAAHGELPTIKESYSESHSEIRRMQHIH